MEAPENVVIGLANLRQSFMLRWNPKAVMTKPGSYSGGGILRPPEYEGRFELWDKTDDSPEYLVTTVHHADGSFRVPDDEWLAFMRRLNPEHWDGDPNRMIQYFIDRPNELRDFVDDQEADDLFDVVARDAGWRITPKAFVHTDNLAPLEG